MVEIRWKGDTARRKVENGLVQRLNIVGAMVAAEIKRSMRGGGLTSHSKPGEPPYVVTGLLRRGITYEVRAAAKSVRVGTNVPYARALEFGSKPHVILPRRGAFLVFTGKDGNKRFARRVQHPGMAPRPFIKPAVLRLRTRIIRAFKGLV